MSAEALDTLYYQYILRIIIVVSFIGTLPKYGYSQNAPVTSISSVATAVSGQQVSVQVTVSQFNNIGSVSLSLDYDYTKLHFVSGTLNNQLYTSGNFALGDNDLGNGMHRVKAGWYGNGNSLQDGAVLLTYIFTYISGSSVLQWFDDGGSCAYSDGSAITLVDTPYSTYYHNGMICGSMVNPAQIDGLTSFCQGSKGVIYTTGQINAADRYVWTVPAGVVITGTQNSNSITVDFPSYSLTGNITVRAENDCGSTSTVSLYVSSMAPPIAYAGLDTTIWAGSQAYLHGSAGRTTSVNYSWTPVDLLTDPNVKDPITINLYTAQIFTLLVTSTVTSCSSSDQILVSVKDIPTGVEDLTTTDKVRSGLEAGIQVFPNPADDYIIIRLNDVSEIISSVSMVSVNGTVIKKIDNLTKTGGNDITVFVGDIKPGIYVLMLNNKKSFHGKKILIQ